MCSTDESILGSCTLEGRGVVTDSPVSDRTEPEDTGREAESWASSNVSCSRSELSALDILESLSAIVVFVVLQKSSARRKHLHILHCPAPSPTKHRPIIQSRRCRITGPRLLATR